MLIVIITILILILIKLSFKGYFLYSKTDSKIYFSFVLFNSLNLLCGYIVKRSLGGYYIHFKNKALIINLKSFNFKGGKGVISACEINEVNLFLSASCNNLSLVYAFKGVLDLFNSLLKLISGQNKAIKYNADLSLYFDLANFYNVGITISFKTNFLRIILTLISNAINKEKYKLEKFKI